MSNVVQRKMNTQHIALIHRLFTVAETLDLPLWLQGGWAIDAKLHRITREHQDIDIAFPIERKAEFLSLLRSHFQSSKVKELELLLDCWVQSALDTKIHLGYEDLRSRYLMLKEGRLIPSWGKFVRAS